MRLAPLTFTWSLLFSQLLLCHVAQAEDALLAIPRIDVHAHCGTPQRMAEYLQISRALKEQHGEQLAAWIDLDFLRAEHDVTADAYLAAANKQYEQRFLPCLHDAIKDGLQYGADDIESWQRKGVVGLKIWVGLSDAIDNADYDPLFAKMAALKFPGASIHIAQPYPTSWCDDPVEFWKAQNAWERVLDRHPQLTVVNAHMLDHFNSDEQLDYLAYMLTTYPNVHVDLAARFQQFDKMDHDKLRAFVIRFQDRILFGTDIGKLMGSPQEMAERYHRCFQLLETGDKVAGSFFDEQERRGLALPSDVLEKLYYRNALRVYPRLKEVAEISGRSSRP